MAGWSMARLGEARGFVAAPHDVEPERLDSVALKDGEGGVRIARGRLDSAAAGGRGGVGASARTMDRGGPKRRLTGRRRLSGHRGRAGGGRTASVIGMVPHRKCAVWYTAEGRAFFGLCPW